MICYLSSLTARGLKCPLSPSAPCVTRQNYTHRPASSPTGSSWHRRNVDRNRFSSGSFAASAATCCPELPLQPSRDRGAVVLPMMTHSTCRSYLGYRCTQKWPKPQGIPLCVHFPHVQNTRKPVRSSLALSEKPKVVYESDERWRGIYS